MKRLGYLNILTVIAMIIIFPTRIESQTTHPALQPNCSYTIQIETTCAPSEETTDHISLTFSDSAGNLVILEHLQNPELLYAPKGWKTGDAYGGFGWCAVDAFKASGTCMDQCVCSLYLKRFGSDGWRPGWVKVLRQQNGGSAVPIKNVFYFRAFVPGNVWYGFDYCHS